VIASRIVVFALLALTAVAAADSFRGQPSERTVREGRTEGQRLVGSTPEYVAEGTGMRTRVTRRGRAYLTAGQIDAAFPAPLEGIPFDVAHLAFASDGTLALAVYKLPATGPIRAAIELWRNGELVSAFLVPTGSFGGGLGFSRSTGRLATVAADERTAVLYSREGKRIGRVRLKG
jgi:hypothetical protein